MIGLVGCAESGVVISWIPLGLVVRIQTPLLATWFGGEAADPMLLGEIPLLLAKPSGRVGICRSFHRPDECGTRPFYVGLGAGP